MTPTTDYAISGMTCSHCEQAVTAELSQLAGVTSVNVSAADGVARVVSDAPLDIAAVRDAIAEAGYDLVDA